MLEKNQSHVVVTGIFLLRLCRVNRRPSQAKCLAKLAAKVLIIVKIPGPRYRDTLNMTVDSCAKICLQENGKFEITLVKGEQLL